MQKSHLRKVEENRSSRFFRRSSCSAARPKKSNITAERLTLLPGFLALGSRTLNTSRNSVAASENDDDNNVLTAPKLRRSWRLCQKNSTLNPSDYFAQLTFEGNRSKSIFKEIKNKCGEREEPFDDNFEQRLFQQLKNFELKESSYYKEQVFAEIEVLNRTLAGKVDQNMSVNRKRSYEEEKENYPLKFPYIPQSNWVFQTPPNRKLNYHSLNVDENGIKPAVIETRDDTKIVYEMNKKINVDLTGFNNRQDIDIDKRYMVEVATSSYGRPQEMSEDKNEFLPGDSSELENHFLSLTCRPKKASTTSSRLAPATLKRKREIFEPQPGSSAADSGDAEWKPMFVDNLADLEESFTFKFTKSGDENNPFGGATTGHLFDFEGNKKNTFNLRF